MENIQNQNLNNPNQNIQNLNQFSNNQNNIQQNQQMNINPIVFNNKNLALNNNITPEKIKELEEKKKNEIKKKLEDDAALVEQIKDQLKCYICLSKVVKPRMCKFCKKICCEECIKKWLSDHNFCGICKNKCKFDDMILIPFLDNMSEFFIQNIDNNPKPNFNDIKNNNFEYKYDNNFNNNNMINNKMIFPTNMINGNYNFNLQNNNVQICKNHQLPLQFYCMQCNQEYCNQCLVFINNEVSKHNGHNIIGINEINIFGFKEAINEYKKLNNTGNNLEKLLNLCNLKLEENEIKKTQINNFFNEITKEYSNKVVDNSIEIKSILNSLLQKKENINKYTFEFTNSFRNEIYSQHYDQGNIFYQELKNINDNNKEFGENLDQKKKINPKIFFEIYDSDFIECFLPSNLGDNNEIFNTDLNFIKNNNSKLIIKPIGNKINIVFIVKINENDKIPKFKCCLILKNRNIGIKSFNFGTQMMNFNGEIVSHLEIDLHQFYMCKDEKNTIGIKLYVTKTYYED